MILKYELECKKFDTYEVWTEYVFFFLSSMNWACNFNLVKWELFVRLSSFSSVNWKSICEMAACIHVWWLFTFKYGYLLVCSCEMKRPAACMPLCLCEIIWPWLHVCPIVETEKCELEMSDSENVLCILPCMQHNCYKEQIMY